MFYSVWLIISMPSWFSFKYLLGLKSLLCRTTSFVVTVYFKKGLDLSLKNPCTEKYCHLHQYIASILTQICEV